MQISLCASLQGVKGREGKVKSEINRPAMQSDTSYDVSREGWRYTSPIKSSRKYFAEVMKTMIKEHRALFVVCS